MIEDEHESPNTTNFALMGQTVHGLKASVEKLDKKIDANADRIDESLTVFCTRIDMIISGDPSDKDKPGLAGQVRDNRRDIDGITRWGKRLMVIITGAFTTLASITVGRWTR